MNNEAQNKITKDVLNAWSKDMNRLISLKKFDYVGNIVVRMVFKKLDQENGFIKFLKKQLVDDEDVRDWHLSVKWTYGRYTENKKTNTYLRRVGMDRWSKDMTNQKIFNHKHALGCIEKINRNVVPSGFSSVEWGSLVDLLAIQTRIWQKSSTSEYVIKAEKKLLKDVAVRGRKINKVSNAL